MSCSSKRPAYDRARGSCSARAHRFSQSHVRSARVRRVLSSRKIISRESIAGELLAGKKENTFKARPSSRRSWHAVRRIPARGEITVDVLCPKHVLSETRLFVFTFSPITLKFTDSLKGGHPCHTTGVGSRSRNGAGAKQHLERGPCLFFFERKFARFFVAPKRHYLLRRSN